MSRENKTRRVRWHVTLISGGLFFLALSIGAGRDRGACAAFGCVLLAGGFLYMAWPKLKFGKAGKEAVSDVGEDAEDRPAGQDR